MLSQSVTHSFYELASAAAVCAHKQSTSTGRNTCPLGSVLQACAGALVEGAALACLTFQHLKPELYGDSTTGYLPL